MRDLLRQKGMRNRDVLTFLDDVKCSAGEDDLSENRTCSNVQRVQARP